MSLYKARLEGGCQASLFALVHAHMDLAQGYSTDLEMPHSFTEHERNPGIDFWALVGS
jgi:hypothetical protein